MIDLVRPSYNLNLMYGQKLIADVPADQMCVQPLPGRVMNHAAWTMGHLAFSSDWGVTQFGQSQALPAEWKGLFSQGTLPDADPAKYPSKQELVQAFEETHARLLSVLQTASPEALNAPTSERMRHLFPTVAHSLLGLMTSHEGTHLGQLSVWRRAMGMPSVF